MDRYEEHHAEVYPEHGEKYPRKVSEGDQLGEDGNTEKVTGAELYTRPEVPILQSFGPGTRYMRVEGAMEQRILPHYEVSQIDTVTFDLGNREKLVVEIIEEGEGKLLKLSAKGGLFVGTPTGDSAYVRTSVKG